MINLEVMKASIIYSSHSGTTKAFAEAIGQFLCEKNMETRVESVSDYDEGFLQSAGLVLIGCWTSGLMFFAQHPDGQWKRFARHMPSIAGKPIALFTTYKLATGSMFRKMEARLKGKADPAKFAIRSKSGQLTDENVKQLESLITNSKDA
jgi:flavodoxin